MPKDLEIQKVIVRPYARALFLIYNKISGRVYLGMIANEKNRFVLGRALFRLPNKFVLGKEPPDDRSQALKKKMRPLKRVVLFDGAVIFFHVVIIA